MESIARYFTINVALLICLIGCQQVASDEDQNIAIADSVGVEIAPEPPPARQFYGLSVDSLEIIQKKIKWGQNLADILLPYEVEYATINTLVKEAKGVFDVRKLLSLLYVCASMFVLVCLCMASQEMENLKEPYILIPICFCDVMTIIRAPVLFCFL